MIYESDAKKENRLVQSSVAAGLPHAKTYHKRIPRGRRDLPEGVWQVARSRRKTAGMPPRGSKHSKEVGAQEA